MASPALLEPRGTPPPSTTDEALYEIVNGQRVELPPLSAYSTLIASRLDQELGPFSAVHRLGIVVCEMLFVHVVKVGFAAVDIADGRGTWHRRLPSG
jgi:hypothetical protein